MEQGASLVLEIDNVNAIAVIALCASKCGCLSGRDDRRGNLHDSVMIAVSAEHHSGQRPHRWEMI